MSAISKTNSTYISDSSSSDRSSKNLDRVNKEMRKRQVQKHSENSYPTQENGVSNSFDRLYEIISSLGHEAHDSEQKEQYLSQLLDESNKLQQNLDNLKSKGEVKEEQIAQINDWCQSAISVLTEAENSKDSAKSFAAHEEVLQNGTELLKTMHAHIESTQPAVKSFAGFLSADSSDSSEEVQTLSHQEEASPFFESSPSAHSGTGSSSSEFNMYTVMISLVFCSNTVVLNALSLKAEVNKNLNQLMNKVQDLLGIISVVNKAYSDASAEAAKQKDTSHGSNFSWTDTSGGKNIAQLLIDSSKPSKNPDGSDGEGFNTDWANNVIDTKTGNPDDIQICVFTENKDGSNKPNDYVKQFSTSTSTTKDGKKYFMSMKDLKRMVQSFGDEMEPFIGGNIANQQPGALSSTSNVTSFIKSVSTSQDNLQSQSATIASKVNLMQSGLNQAISNFLTMASNQVSVSFQLAVK